MIQSSFHFELVESMNIDFLLITDLNRGMSLVSDIKNVIAYITSMCAIDLAEHLIIYRDSDGIWDGYDYKKQIFISLSTTTFEAAIKKYIEIQKRSVHTSIYQTILI